jgi:hypothetical protein
VESVGIYRERERGKVVVIRRERGWLTQVIKNSTFNEVGSDILPNLKYCLILSSNKGL